jgi:glutamine amidotransferase
VHSYAAHPAQEEQIVASVEYGGETVVAAVARENIFGTQFHPEKSQGAGIRLLGDFVARL